MSAGLRESEPVIFFDNTTAAEVSDHFFIKIMQ